MILSETLFIQGMPAGNVCTDTNSGQVTFKPKVGYERLTARKWKSVSACQKAVTKYYAKESSPPVLHQMARSSMN